VLLFEWCVTNDHVVRELPGRPNTVAACHRIVFWLPGISYLFLSYSLINPVIGCKTVLTVWPQFTVQVLGCPTPVSRGSNRALEMVLLDRVTVTSYGPSIVTKPLALTIWTQFAIQILGPNLRWTSQHFEGKIPISYNFQFPSRSWMKGRQLEALSWRSEKSDFAPAPFGGILKNQNSSSNGKVSENRPRDRSVLRKKREEGRNRAKIEYQLPHW